MADANEMRIYQELPISKRGEEHYCERFDPSAPLQKKLEFIHRNNKIPAILHAAEYGDLEVCKELLEQGEDVNATDVFGYDVYHFASMNETCGLELIDLFAAHGAIMKRKSWQADLDAVELALSENNNVEFAIKLFNLYKSPASFLSCYLRQSDDLELMKLAFEKDPSVAKVKGEDGFDKTISCNVARKLNLDVFEWILEVIITTEEDLFYEKKWQLDILKYSAFNKLHGGDIANCIFSLLISNLTREDLTPLLVTVVSSRMPEDVNMNVVGLLVENGAYVNARINGKSLLDHFVASNSLSAAQDVYKWSRKEICASTLHYAAAKADVEMCEWLVGRPMAANMGNKIPVFLHSVTENHKHGANLIRRFDRILRDYVNVASGREPDDLKTPLQSAMYNRNLGVAEALLEIGADLNVKYNTYNLLMYCLWNNFLDGAKLVYARDRSQLGTDALMNLALHLAKFNKNKTMEQWLRGIAVSPIGR